MALETQRRKEEKNWRHVSYVTIWVLTSIITLSALPSLGHGCLQDKAGLTALWADISYSGTAQILGPLHLLAMALADGHAPLLLNLALLALPALAAASSAHPKRPEPTAPDRHVNSTACTPSFHGHMASPGGTQWTYAKCQ